MAAERYYVVPPSRVVLYGILSFGMYPYVWCYRQWRWIKRQDKTTIWPIARAIFANFSFFLLIHDINDRIRRANEGGATISELGSGLGLAFFLVLAVGRYVPDELVFGLLVALSICLLPPARRIAELAGPEAVTASRKMSSFQFVLCAVGGILWLLFLAGLLLGDPGNS